MVTGEQWFENAADLLEEDEPGPTPYLVESLIVEGSIAALVGPPKKGKTWTLLDIAIAVATGEKALGRFEVVEPGPVLLILEESGRTALHRRLDKLARGRALKSGRLEGLYFAANRRVRLDNDEWRERLLGASVAEPWRLIGFDPLARLKGATVDENVQREIGPVLDFLRELREEHGAAVLYVHHTPHDGTRHRGSSDLEAYWESKLTLVESGVGRTLQAEHREAEGAGPFALSFGWDAPSGTLRLRVSDDPLVERVRELLEAEPDSTATAIYETLKEEGAGARKATVLEVVKTLREAGSQSPEPLGTLDAGQLRLSGSPAPPLRGAGTEPADMGTGPVPESGNHRSLDEEEVERLAAVARSFEDDEPEPVLDDEEPVAG